MPDAGTCRRRRKGMDGRVMDGWMLVESVDKSGWEKVDGWMVMEGGEG